MYKANFSILILSECVKAVWAKFGIEVWPGAGKVKDRTTITDFTDLTLEDQGGLPVNSPDCMVLNQSVNHTWKNLKGALNDKFQKRKPSRRTNGGFVNDVLSSWDEMKIEHIRNAIDAQKEVMFEIIEKQGGYFFSEHRPHMSKYMFFCFFFIILWTVESVNGVNCPFSENGHFAFRVGESTA